MEPGGGVGVNADGIESLSVNNQRQKQKKRGSGYRFHSSRSSVPIRNRFSGGTVTRPRWDRPEGAHSWGKCSEIGLVMSIPASSALRTQSRCGQKDRAAVAPIAGVPDATGRPRRDADGNYRTQGTGAVGPVLDAGRESARPEEPAGSDRGETTGWTLGTARRQNGPTTRCSPTPCPQTVKVRESVGVRLEIANTPSLR